MATKKRKEQLESLLDWEREGDRLPKTTDLFNRQISEHLFLREVTDKLWAMEFVEIKDDGINKQTTLIKHSTLIQLWLSILDAVKQADDRFLKERLTINKKK